MSKKNDFPTVAQVLGEIVWLLSQSSGFKEIKISSLESRIMPALLLKQFRIFYDAKHQPVGCAIWALLNEAVARRIEDGIGNGNVLLNDLNEWKSGPIPWVMELVSPYFVEKPEFQNEMLSQISSTNFAGSDLKYFQLDEQTGSRSSVETFYNKKI